MRRARKLSVLLLSPLFLTLGCGQPHGNGLDEDNPTLHLVLKAWSPLTHHAYPATDVPLKVVAFKSAGSEINDATDLVPAAGEPIAWRILGSPPAGALLSTNASAADAQGIAAVTVSVGTSPNTTLQIEAAAAGADPVTFTVQVGRDERALQLLVAPTLSSTVDRTERLRVRLVRPIPGGGIGGAIAGASVQAELLGGVTANGARLEPNPGNIVELTTDAAGVATVRLHTGSVTSPGLQISFTHTGAPPVSVTVVVTQRGIGGADCQYFTDCDTGFVCDLGVCKPVASYCDADTDCPTGYLCGAGRLCQLNDGETCVDASTCNGEEICGAAGCCIPPDGCLSNTDCASGWTCEPCSGACLPPSTEDALDVRGLWFTTYHFDISDTLPGFFTNGLGPVVDFLNILFAGQIDIGIPIIGDILEAMLNQLVAEYVPPWVQTIVAVLADFIHLFENMEVEGEMFLTQSPESPRLGTNVAGDEDWTSAQFFIVSFCPGGPAQFAQDPSCGRIDVILDSNIPVDYSNNDLLVGVSVDPFIGEVLGDTLRLNGRDVEVGMLQLVNVLLDVIVLTASGGQWADFETFLVDIVPCYDFQLAVDDLFCDITGGDICSVPGIEALCTVAAVAATDALTTALGQVGVGLDVEFDQRALIHDVPLGGAADILGDPLNPSNTVESALIGSSDFLFFGGDLDENSWWWALRDRD